jgi:hypothetical protein
LIKVKIVKTSDRKFEEIKEFVNLEDAINYCYDLKEKEVGIWEYKVIVKNSSKWIYTNEAGLDYELEIYDALREQIK